MKRNKYSSAKRIISIIDKLERNEEVEYNWVMEQFGVKLPQARSDIKLVQEFRNLRESRNGKFKVFKLAPDFHSAPSIVARAVMLEFGKSSLNMLRGTIYEEESEALCRELKRHLPKKSVSMIKSITESFYHRYANGPQNSYVGAAVEDILTCFHTRSKISIDSRRLYDEMEKRYHVGPIALVLWQEQLQLVGIKFPDNEFRSFDLDGIKNSEVLTDTEFHCPDSFNIEDYYKYAIGRYVGSHYKVIDLSFVVKDEWSIFFKRRKVHPSQRIQDSDGGLRVRMRVGNCPDLKAFIMKMMPNIKIEKPIEVKNEIKKILEASLEQI